MDILITQAMPVMCRNEKVWVPAYLSESYHLLMDSAWQSDAKHLHRHGLSRKSRTKNVFTKSMQIYAFDVCITSGCYNRVIQVLDNLDTALFWYFEFSNPEWKHLYTDVFCNVAARSQYYQSTVQTAKEQSEHIQTFSQHYIKTVPKTLIAYFPSAFINHFLKSLC